MDDFSGLEYEQESVSEEDVISKTNSLLSQFNLPTQVTSISDITASLFVVLYESLFSDRLPGIVRQPETKEDEISNCQMVIDVLSADVIKDNLSHIRGVDIVEGKRQAINNLLDIFTFLFEYVIKQIESDTPTDTDDDAIDAISLERVGAVGSERPVSSPDSMERELDEPWAGDRPVMSLNGSLPSSVVLEKPYDWDMHPGLRISRGEGFENEADEKSVVSAETSPDMAIALTSKINSVDATVDTTADMIREAEQLDRQFERERVLAAAAIKAPRDKPPSSKQEPGPFDFIGMRPAPTSAFSAEAIYKKTDTYTAMGPSHPHCVPDALLGLGRGNSASVNESKTNLPKSDASVTRLPKQDCQDMGLRNLSATEPVPSEYTRPRSPARMRSTVAEVPPRPIRSQNSCFEQSGEPDMNKGKDAEPGGKGLSTSYGDLHQMVEHIAALSRAAVSTSPLSGRHQDTAAQLSITDFSQERHGVPPSEEELLARELNNGGMSLGEPQLLYDAVVSVDDPLSLTTTEPSKDGPRELRDPSQYDVPERLQETEAATPEVRISPLGETRAPAARKSTSGTSSYIPPNTDYVRPSTSASFSVARASSSAVRASATGVMHSISPDRMSASGVIPSVSGVSVVPSISTVRTSVSGHEPRIMPRMPSPSTSAARPSTSAVRASTSAARTDVSAVRRGTSAVRPSTSGAHARGGRRSPSRSQSERIQPPYVEARHKARAKADSDKEIERAGARKKERSVSQQVPREYTSCSRHSLRQVQEPQAQLSTRLQDMGKPTLANAQQHLEAEQKRFQQKHEFLKKLYQEDFGEAVDEVRGLLATDHKLLKAKEEEYKKLLALINSTASKNTMMPSPKPKGVLMPKTKRIKSKRCSMSPRGRTSSEGPMKAYEESLKITEDEEIMPALLEEFPHLYMADNTWHELRRKGIHQIESLTRAYEENKRRKSKAQVQLEEAAKKHEMMAQLVKKQLDHNQRMQSVKEEKRQQVVVANRMHEKRSQSARTRRYYNEYQVRARAKLMKQRTREELVFKNLFKDGLAIQKERIQEVRRYAKEHREKQARRRQNEIDSIEKYYQDQFEVLVEKLVTDRQAMTARENAHQKLLDQMKRELRTKMEKEIQEIQSQMFRDDDDVYLRQLEADRMRHKLQRARCQTRI